MTSGIGTRECHLFRKKIFDFISPLAYDAAHKYLKLSKQHDYVQANRFLSSLNKHLHLADLNLTSDIKELKAFAKSKAMECLRDTADLSEAHALCLCKAKLLKYKISIHDDISATEGIIQARSEKFWFNKLKRIASQKVEEIRRQLDLVNQKKSAYCSSDRLRQFKWEKEQALEFMKSKWFCSADGEFISMLDAYQANVSNPEVRRAELMVRIKGTEEYSKLLNHVGCFYTITTPSKFHSHYQSGKPNPKYLNYSVKDANEYLNAQWRKARAQFHREGIEVFGLRVVEPHHDGTPHWHLLLFTPPEQLARVTSILRHYAMEDDADESGADKNRFKAEPIDPEKGSAQDYIAKYICKNIDGEFLDTDNYGNDAKQSASKITAWASLYNIRQFQFLGLPSVTLWRQLRKLELESSDTPLGKLQKAADESDWLSYLIMMGGANVKRIERPFSLEYENQIKTQYQHCELSTLSKHAYNQKPKHIRFTEGTYAIPDKNWQLFSSPAERVDSPPSQREGRAVDEGSGGSRRRLGISREGKAPKAEGILDLCK